MILELNDLSVSCIIGDLPHEREKEQIISIDVSLTLDDKIAETDNLEDGVDYAMLSGELSALLKSAKCRLIERAAHMLLDLCLEKKGVKAASVRVTKKGAIPFLASAAAVASGDNAGAFPEYELSGIEVISRGVCIKNGKILLCRAKGAKSTYLPGGHIEFGETGRIALEREMMEETGIEIKAGKFLGCVENSFLQHGKPHSEINFVFAFSLPTFDVASKERHIEFLWHELSEISSANLLPKDFERIGSAGDCFFEI